MWLLLTALAGIVLCSANQTYEHLKFSNVTAHARSSLKEIANSPEYTRLLQSSGKQLNRALASNPKTKHLQVSSYLTTNKLKHAAKFFDAENTHAEITSETA